MSLRAASRLYATAASSASTGHHKVVVVGAGSAGLNVANMLYNRFQSDAKTLSSGDIAIVDGSEYHHYQPGWTLVGTGLAQKEALRRTTSSLIPSHLTLHPSHASTFSPTSNSLTLASGEKITYDFLVVCPGLKLNPGAVEGLEAALKAGTKESAVGSVYTYDGCDQVWEGIRDFKGQKAIFTQPKGIIKCAGAPQKVMWMARSQFANDKKSVDVEFISGMPSMFAVPKYSEALSKLADERGVTKTLDTNLTAIDHLNRRATFLTGKGETVTRDFDFLHVVPPQGPLDVIKNSELSDESGWVTVDPASLQHTKFANVFALGDASSLPTSKTAAAITGQTPVVVENLAAAMNGLKGQATYGGYTSCPLLTGHGELMLAEFKYGLQPDETFSTFFNQAKPNRAFYHLKKDVFPAVYFSQMVRGQWFGRTGPLKPSFPKPVEASA